MNKQEEVWKDIPELKGHYQASSLGRIRSVDRNVKTSTGSGTFLKKGRIMKLQLHPKLGRFQVSICINGKPKQRKVHQLVCAAFYGEKPIGNEVNHIDGNRQNNCANNLEWCTPEQNIEHKYKHKLFARGRGVTSAKLDESKVCEILKLIPLHTDTHIGKLYGVSRRAIAAIRKGETWRHAYIENETFVLVKPLSK